MASDHDFNPGTGRRVTSLSPQEREESEQKVIDDLAMLVAQQAPVPGWWDGMPEMDKNAYRRIAKALRDAIVQNVIDEIEVEQRWADEQRRRPVLSDSANITFFSHLSRLDVIKRCLTNRWWPERPLTMREAHLHIEGL